MAREFDEPPAEGQSWTERGVTVDDERAAILLQRATTDEAERVVTTLRADPQLPANEVVGATITEKEPEA